MPSFEVLKRVHTYAQLWGNEESPYLWPALRFWRESILVPSFEVLKSVHTCGQLWGFEESRYLCPALRFWRKSILVPSFDIWRESILVPSFEVLKTVHTCAQLIRADCLTPKVKDCHHWKTDESFHSPFLLTQVFHRLHPVSLELQTWYVNFNNS